MGESKRGGGSGRRPRADQVLRQLVADYSSQGVDVAEIRAQRITQGVYAIEVHEHGGGDPERFFLATTPEGEKVL
jgi:hypothetical protein